MPAAILARPCRQICSAVQVPHAAGSRLSVSAFAKTPRHTRAVLLFGRESASTDEPRMNFVAALAASGAVRYHVRETSLGRTDIPGGPCESAPGSIKSKAVRSELQNWQFGRQNRPRTQGRIGCVELLAVRALKILISDHLTAAARSVRLPVSGLACRREPGRTTDLVARPIASGCETRAPIAWPVADLQHLPRHGFSLCPGSDRQRDCVGTGRRVAVERCRRERDCVRSLTIWLLQEWHLVF